ncbi:LysR family transcriptional regulator [Roseomonas nepalensis]|uniref:LysR family transcriptional regulator n=1 Tax=Muricoccus nepalensis TaxID=1854500 RepID=A0A502GJA5_9PROT|nr:LysR substrate-binding domain-containing protein [Roseomonas nepalensis]TPG61390.1 LysR family transcriptional regulator [Roseomonas nepalensis]
MHLPLRAITVFHAAARAGTLARAAQELGVTPSAVSQQIAALEMHLGTTLMVRSGRRAMLTEAGERYFAMIAENLDRVADATQAIRGSLSSRSLTVRVTPTLATKWLLPRLGRFLDAHADIDLRVDATNEPTDFAREAVDVDIRHGEGNWPGLFVEGLAEERFLPVCAPSLCPPGSLAPGDLPRHRLIHSVKSQMQWPRWFGLAEVPGPASWRRVLFDRSHMAIDAAAAGIGIALESELMMERELREGLLACPVRRPPVATRVTQWLVCPHDRLRRSQVGAFLGWLRAERDLWQARRND